MANMSSSARRNQALDLWPAARRARCQPSAVNRGEERNERAAERKGRESASVAPRKRRLVMGAVRKAKPVADPKIDESGVKAY
jgi:hypothetical protein